MKRLLLVAAALLVAAPALAQTDKYDDGDWWQGTGPERPNVILVQGMGTRAGDKVTVPLFFFYAEPNHAGAIGIRAIAEIDCTTITYRMTYTTMFAVGRPPKDFTPRERDSQPLEKTSPLRRLLCEGDDSNVRHFKSRSRRAALVEVFGHYPGE